MLTRQNVFASTSSCVETIPLGLVTTEDGRTLLAVAENEDTVLAEIMTNPVTLIAPGGAAATFVKNLDGSLILQQPVFQISEEHMEAAGLDRSALLPVQTLTSSSFVLEQSGSYVDAQAKQERSIDIRFDPPCNADAMTECKSGKDTLVRDVSLVAPTKNSPPKRNSGRPRKTEAISPQVTRNLKCDICQEEFDKQSLYRKHMENHAEEKPHRCPKCPASFNIPSNFTLHMATHNTGDPKCPECGRKFARMASLKSHMLLHEKEENLFCSECEDAFSTKAQLDAHLKLHGEKWTSEEARKCKLCNKQFLQPALYRLHIREHYRLQTKIVKQTKRGAKHKTMYKCTICLKSFQKPSQLMRHIRVHTGEKPFKCTVCGRAFTQKSSLQIHTWQHNGIRPHTCDLCNAKFSQKGNLNAHIMRVHQAPEGEPIYGCTYCSCIFKKLGSLNGHIKRMHANTNEINPAKCDGPATVADMRATVNNVMTQLASLESESKGVPASPTDARAVAATKNDILQQALKNSGLPSKNKMSAEETRAESRTIEARTSFVTLLDRAPDGGARKYLTIRQRCVGGVRWYACSFCHKEFKKPSDLIRHLRVHTQEKPFKCTHCFRSFALKSTMIAHERTHSGTKRYGCGSCEKTFACHGSLVAHAKQHDKSGVSLERVHDVDNVDGETARPPKDNGKNETGNENEKENGEDSGGGGSGGSGSGSGSGTGNANRGCNGTDDVDVDVDVDAVSKSQAKSQSKGKSKLCPEAESLVPRVVLQEPLVISDTGNRICVAQVPPKQKRGCEMSVDASRPHKCWVCYAAFRKISHLKQHYRRHTGERPYKCAKCERRFTSNSVLKSHLHTHEDLRPYSCSVCGSKFSTQSSMKRHLVTHSSKRPFMCPYCHKTFKTYVNCRKHMKIHRQELAQRQLEQEKARVEKSRVVGLDENDGGTDSVFSENIALPEGIEISFQSQIAPDFAHEFSGQLQTVTERKEKTSSETTPSIVSQSLPEVALENLETSHMLHADETGTVTLPAYSTDQPLTSESIREIEETLNQQLFNIGMNLDLGNALSKPLAENGNENEHAREPSVLNVIYENQKNVDSSGNSAFAAQFDSFDMAEMALQPVAEMDIGIEATSSASMASILPRSSEEQRLMPVAVVTSGKQQEQQSRLATRTMLLIARQHPCAKYPKLAAKGNAGDGPELGRRSDAPQKYFFEVNASNCENERGTPAFVAKPEAVRADEMMVGGVRDSSEISREESLLQCHMCDEQGFTTLALKEHLKSHRGAKEYQCHECSLRFCTNGGLSRHSKMHACKPQWRCAICRKAFVSKQQLRSHGKLVHREIAWNFSTADRDTSRKNETVITNAKLSTAESPSPNPHGIEADSSISEKVLLDTVAEREVMNGTGVTSEKHERKEYTNRCKYCPKTFRKPSDLIRHTRTHTGERPFSCEYCSKSFAVKCTLDSHTKVHTGKKAFRCHVCSSLFATKGSLKVHMRLHTGSKPFRCNVCDLRFRTSGHRKVHLLKHGREQRNSPKRKQKHSKVAAIAEVVASLERSEDEASKRIEVFQEREEKSCSNNENQEYPVLEEIGIAAGLTDQITFNTDGTISNNNSVLSVNESHQLVANLHFLLENGLVTIQTEDAALISQPENVECGDPIGDSLSSSATALVSASEIANGTLTDFTERMVESSMGGMPEITRAGKTERLGAKQTSRGNPSKKECDICGKTFTKPYQVERHKRIHTGERPYKCDLCAKSFAQKSTLQMHQKHHTGDRPYPCQHCEYSFTQKGNLRTHVKRVHQLDTLDVKKFRRARQALAAKSSQDDISESKILTLEDIPFVELK